MAFNLPQFLRRTTRASLKEYFRFRSIDLAASFDWSAAEDIYLKGLRAEVENLSDGARERVYQDFEHADLLAMSRDKWRSVRSLQNKQASCWQSRAWTTAKPAAWLL